MAREARRLRKLPRDGAGVQRSTGLGRLPLAGLGRSWRFSLWPLRLFGFFARKTLHFFQSAQSALEIFTLLFAALLPLELRAHFEEFLPELVEVLAVGLLLAIELVEPAIGFVLAFRQLIEKFLLLVGVGLQLLVLGAVRLDGFDIFTDIVEELGDFSVKLAHACLVIANSPVGLANGLPVFLGLLLVLGNEL